VEIEAIGVHHLGPRGHEVLNELLLGVCACIDFRERAELRVRSEDQVYTRPDPPGRIRLAIPSFAHIFTDRLPYRVHAEEIDEEIIRQLPGLPGEDTVL